MSLLSAIAKNANLPDVYDKPILRYDGHDLMTADQAAQLLGLTAGTLRRYIRSGQLEVITRIGKAQLVRRTDVEALERRGRGRPRKEADTA